MDYLAASDLIPSQLLSLSPSQTLTLSHPAIPTETLKFIMGRSAHYTSPSTRIRNVRRLIKYLSEKKSKPHLLVTQTLPPIDIKPVKIESRLSVKRTFPVNISPTKKSKNLVFSLPTVCSYPSILPKPSFHPHIVEASNMIYEKHPIDLTHEERMHFLGYQQYKIRNGLSIEEDSVYKPRDDP